MCSFQECPLSNQCKRFISTPSELYQSYFVSTPYLKTPENNFKSCEYYWPVYNKKSPNGKVRKKVS